MGRATRWAIGLLLPCLLSACTTTGKGVDATSIIQLDKPIHFTAPSGTAVLASPDDYLVESTTDGQLRLQPQRGGLPLLLAADAVTHDIELSGPIPLLLAFGEDTRDLVLLLPDGTALDAAGSLSGVQTRDIVRPRRHYQLAYYLDPTTGQVRFGDGAKGQRPPTSPSNISASYQIDVGPLPRLNQSPSSERTTIQLQQHLSDLQNAEALAGNVSKKLEEGFRLEFDTDRPGNDYGQRVTSSAEACRSICSGDGNCQAFTFVKPPAGSLAGQCFLKRTVPTPVGNSCCISAKRTSTRQELIQNIGK